MRIDGRNQFLAALCAVLLAGSAVTAPVVDEAAPDFALRSLDGRTMRLSELRSEVVLLHFSSKWCSRCRQAVPAYESLYRLHGADGLRVLGVDVEGRAADAAARAAEWGVTFPVLLDADQTVSRMYDLNQLPMTVLLDREGRVRFVDKGYRGDAGDRLTEALERLLAE